METTLPTPMTGRVYVNLLEGKPFFLAILSIPLSKPEYVTNEISSCCGGFSSINHRKRARSASRPVMILHCLADTHTHTWNMMTHVHTYIHIYSIIIYIYIIYIYSHNLTYLMIFSRIEQIFSSWSCDPQSDQAKAASSAKALEAAFGTSFCHWDMMNG